MKLKNVLFIAAAFALGSIANQDQGTTKLTNLTAGATEQEKEAAAKQNQDEPLPKVINQADSANLEWETVNRQGLGRGASMTLRTRVPGGWLVQVRYKESRDRNNAASIGVGVGLTFYPDPDHLWKLDK
jgi:hypothetical protein